eukprot:370734-Pelagomonas_calceolata.AAC.2
MFVRSASQTHPLYALTFQLQPQACRWIPGCALITQVATCCELAGGWFMGCSRSAKRRADDRDYPINA